MSFFKKKNINVSAGAGTSTNSDGSGDYFKDAASWNYERYHMQQVIANRWQLAFWVQLCFAMTLVVVLVMLFPLKSWDPIVVYRNANTNEVRVEMAKFQHLPESHAEVEGDLVRYLVERETYTFADYHVRFDSVIYKSSPKIAEKYRHALNENNPDALVHKLGRSGYRTVKVEDVIFLDAGREAKKNQTLDQLARVNFETTEKQGQSITKKKWVATIRWVYLGTPKTKKAAWMNWNGFAVTYYRVDQRNI